MPSAESAAFAAIVRTTGARPEPLRDALESLALQEGACVPLVAVHGDGRALSAVKRICRAEGGRSPAVVLHASDIRRKRGYPVNLALDYCRTRLPRAQYVFLLDDDDVVYPFFTSMLAAAFEASGADVVYAASNRREAGQALAPGFAFRPYPHLFIENLIPSNSYAVRAATLFASGLRMEEDADYMEDWRFLLGMVEKGFRFQALPMTLSEFRIVADADLVYRRDLAEWKAQRLRMREYINRSSFLLPGAELARMSFECARPEQDSGAAAGSRGMDRARIAALRQRIWDLEHSLSWRWMAPARSVAGALQGLRRRLGVRA